MNKLGYHLFQRFFFFIYITDKSILYTCIILTITLISRPILWTAPRAGAILVANVFETSGTATSLTCVTISSLYTSVYTFTNSLVTSLSKTSRWTFQCTSSSPIPLITSFSTVLWFVACFVFAVHTTSLISWKQEVCKS